MTEELKGLIEAQGRAFEEFKAANDERIAKLAKGEAVSDIEEKLSRLNARLDSTDAAMQEIAKKANRLGAASTDERSAVAAEHKAAYVRWLRKGDEEGLAELEKKAWQVGVNADGGYAVPEQLDRDIMRLLTDFSPMRQVCRVVPIGGERFRKLVNIGGTTSGWVGETTARTATATSQLKQLTPDMGEVYALPMVTQQALDDLFFNVEVELTRDVAESFAKQEGDAWLNGDPSNNQPKGLLTAPTAVTKDGVRPFGTVQHVATGVANDFAATDPADSLLDLIYACKAGHRMNGKFMLNSATLATIRKWKDKEGRYLWQPSMQLGEPATIHGYQAVVNEFMPDAGTDAIPVVFGDFAAAYWIFDRVGIRILRDPYTNKPYVGFYTTKRVGSMLVNSEAVKFLKCAV